MFCQQELNCSHCKSARPMRGLAHGFRVLTGKLVGVASAWPEFITTARTMLIARGSGCGNDHLSRRPEGPVESGDWNSPNAVICDADTATLPTFPRAGQSLSYFTLLADSMRAELSRYPDTPSAL